MDPLRYLLILLACLAVTLPLELLLGARVYRRPRRLLAALAPVVALFVLWDLAAVARGHWWFDPRYTTGVRLLGLPVEEWLFFVVVPLCALLTYEVLGRTRHLLRLGRGPSTTESDKKGPFLSPQAGGGRGR
ncbi:lycopene cyclase domain-containing protein [Catellatospora sp. KI3]|uniref:lycopene cyclase domain-containing protein n=1 Tax=Catellatospora sp. KI3 TaxID=3041620 RepID=UPI0024828F8F|nr:lycopene cyclase domain-containing protein [Catellatospora sp. KI3]MDI1462963.1 lycopene cyclase domain-containing protein [Catellatospora sp. KI3]